MTEGAGDSDGEKIFKCEGNSRKNQNQKWSLKMQLHRCQLLTKGYQVSSCFLWAEWSKQLKMEPVSAEDAVRRSSRRFRTSHRHSQEAGRNFRGSRRSSTLGKHSQTVPRTTEKSSRKSRVDQCGRLHFLPILRTCHSHPATSTLHSQQPQGQTRDTSLTHPADE